MTKTQNKALTAVYELDSEGNWLASVKELPQVNTFGRTLQKAEQMLRDAIALWLNTDASVDLRPTYRLPKSLEQERQQLLTEKQQLDIEQKRVNSDTQRFVAALVAAGISVRDIGRLLGVSFQRAQQLKTTNMGSRTQLASTRLHATKSHKQVTKKTKRA